MNNRLYTVLIFIVSALMLAAAAIALRSGSRLQPSGDEPDEPIVEEEGLRVHNGNLSKLFRCQQARQHNTDYQSQSFYT